MFNTNLSSLKNFARTNELLGKFNDFSSSKYDVLQHMFLQHTRLLADLKKDLTNAFLRIRRLKVKLQKQYPEAFEATFNLRQNLEDRLEQEEASEPTYVNNAKDRSINKKGKKKSKNENVEADQGTIEINDDLSAENGIESLGIENENSGLLNEAGKENDDLNSEIKHDKINTMDKTESCGLDKTEFSENCVVNDEGTNKESERMANDGISCGNSDCFETDVIETENTQEDDSVHLEVKSIENVQEGNGYIDHDNDEVAEGIKVETEGIKDCPAIESSTEIQTTADDKCCDETNGEGD
ncbi:Hypothetical predicted protein [Paramuricea clavata]|uniref:Uncharacterized protein n=1 Tax=Paramuricea clavata TaxID=317549 RepID=A0A7D9DFS7_PARCT|nr:Hypothetical predicted protein [Paramuricea clavata]